MAHPGRTRAHGTKSAFTQITQPTTMEASSRSLWQCSTCTLAANKCAAVECAMCGAVVRAKLPASPVPSSDATSKPRKATKKLPPQDSPPPTDAVTAVLAGAAGVAAAVLVIGQPPRGDALPKELHRFQVGNKQGRGVTKYFHDRGLVRYQLLLNNISPLAFKSGQYVRYLHIEGYDV